MSPQAISPKNVSAPVGGYSHGLAVREGARRLYISGQIPDAPDGTVPPDFAGQCRQVWRNIEAILAEGGMSLADLVKITTFLSDRRFAGENGEIRREVLGDLRPALTVVVVQTLEPQWLLEIEAEAVAEG